MALGVGVHVGVELRQLVIVLSIVVHQIIGIHIVHRGEGSGDEEVRRPPKLARTPWSTLDFHHVAVGRLLGLPSIVAVIPAALRSASPLTAPLKSAPLPTARSPTAPWSASPLPAPLSAAAVPLPPLPTSPSSVALPRSAPPLLASTSLSCQLAGHHDGHRRCSWSVP
ncbi:unnamed protein product [Closterium sp. NIES-54]